MQISNIYQAKTILSNLVDLALSGEDIITARAGKPLVRLVPFSGRPSPRKPGLFKGKIVIPQDFDQESPEINQLFEGTSK